MDKKLHGAAITSWRRCKSLEHGDTKSITSQHRHEAIYVMDDPLTPPQSPDDVGTTVIMPTTVWIGRDIVMKSLSSWKSFWHCHYVTFWRGTEITELQSNSMLKSMASLMRRNGLCVPGIYNDVRTLWRPQCSPEINNVMLRECSLILFIDVGVRAEICFRWHLLYFNENTLFWFMNNSFLYLYAIQY